MAFVKVLKSNVYCSRYQTKYLRRRQGKTDYFARRRLVFQDKNKYDMKKYRLCVRRTNRRIIASVIYATIQGDRTITQADSQELRRFGITAGLTNYASAYATGLLVARRLLTLKNMAKIYEGQVKVDGKMFSVWDDIKEDRRPFKANLDVGLIRTTTGNRVFGVMKGACDGGLHVPHSEKRFPGFARIKQVAVTNKRGKKVENDDDKKKTEYKPEVHKDHIMGGHVQTYYDILKKGDANRFQKQFSNWEKCLTAAKAKNIQDLYAKCHVAIRAKPEAVKKAAGKPVRKTITAKPALVQEDSKGRKWLRQLKEASSVKKERIAKVMAQVRAKFGRA